MYTIALKIFLYSRDNQLGPSKWVKSVYLQKIDGLDLKNLNLFKLSCFQLESIFFCKWTMRLTRNDEEKGQSVFWPTKNKIQRNYKYKNLHNKTKNLKTNREPRRGNSSLHLLHRSGG